MLLTDADRKLLAELDAAEEKATKGPWERGGPWPTVTVIVMEDPGCGWPQPEPPTYAPVAYLHECGDDFETPPPSAAVADADFIALARNHYRDLRDMIRRLEQQIVAEHPPERDDDDEPATLDFAGEMLHDLDCTCVAFGGKLSVIVDRFQLRTKRDVRELARMLKGD